MPASEFLRKVTAADIEKASDDSDKAEDAARGTMMSGPEFIERMFARLAREYPGIHERINQLVDGQRIVGNPELLLLGVRIGATMLAHELTITAEVHDAVQLLGGSDEQS